MSSTARTWLCTVLWLGALGCAPTAPAAAPPPAKLASKSAVAAKALPEIDQALHSTPAASAETPNAAASATTAALTRIDDRSMVCMLSGRYFGRPQVPTEVDGKTYYGCCGGCAARLSAQAPSRSAIDPVTGHSVDKATAVLAYNAQRRVLYFESEATLADYQKQLASQ